MQTACSRRDGMNRYIASAVRKILKNRSVNQASSKMLITWIPRLGSNTNWLTNLKTTKDSYSGLHLLKPTEHSRHKHISSVLTSLYPFLTTSPGQKMCNSFCFFVFCLNYSAYWFLKSIQKNKPGTTTTKSNSFLEFPEFAAMFDHVSVTPRLTSTTVH